MNNTNENNTNNVINFLEEKAKREARMNNIQDPQNSNNSSVAPDRLFYSVTEDRTQMFYEWFNEAVESYFDLIEDEENVANFEDYINETIEEFKLTPAE